MAEEERLAAPLQTSVLTVLAFDNSEHGAALAAQVKPDHFDNVYRDFATRVLQYRRRYRKAPGKNYIKDLAAAASFGKEDSLVERRLIPNMLAEVDGLNAEHIASRAFEFTRSQTLKGAIAEAIDRYRTPDEARIEDIEKIFSGALRARHETLDAGLFLNDPAGLEALTRNDYISLGIPVLDHLDIGLIPQELLLYIAPKGAGKTWFCVHCGRQALIQRLRVVHVTLEMGERKIFRRYYQNLFSVARKPEKYNRTILEFDELRRLSGFRTRSVTPHLDMSNPQIRKILLNKMKAFGLRIGGLVIKSFPTSQLTLDQLEAYLDYLEAAENFIPNVLIVDYPKLMKKGKEIRIDIGANVEGLRGICQRRNLMGVAPHQGTRETIGARRTRSSQAGEDISVVQTADTVLSFQRTEAEKRLGLGRLSVEHARDCPDGIMILLTQSYETGQYVLQSTMMNAVYWERLREIGGDDALERDEGLADTD